MRSSMKNFTPSSRSTRNIVMCFDGTGNSFETPDCNSNVVKLYQSLTIDERQIAYYHPGVGTMGSPNSRSAIGRELSRIRGLAFGRGLMLIVADAYRYLMDNYSDGDRIYIFGFSRGAYTARVFASLLHVYGLLCAGNEGLIPYILRLYQRQSKASDRKKSTFPTDEAFKWTFAHSMPVDIHFCGLWDTVSTYGWIYNPINLPFLGSNPIILTGRHAVSIHERRCLFRDNLWGNPLPHQTLQQVWFSGVHSDIGGSYPESTSALSKISLEWMLVEATDAALLLNHDRVQVILGRTNPDPPIPLVPAFVRPDATGKLNESLKGAWWIAEFLPQLDSHVGRKLYIPAGSYRTIPPNSALHASVLEGHYAPKNLPPHTVVPYRPFPADIPVGDIPIQPPASPAGTLSL